MNLLLDESPLVIQPTLAAALGGADEAVIVQQVHYWLRKKNAMERDGFRWVYRSYSEWLGELPWMTERTLRRKMADLEQLGVLVSGQLGGTDRRKWYRVDYDKLQMQAAALADSKRPNWPDGASQNGRLYKQETPTETKTENKTLAPTAQKQDPLFEAVAKVCGIDWRNGLTRTSRGPLNTATGELRALDVDPNQVYERASNWPATFPNATLTPMALVKHWPQLVHAPPARANGHDPYAEMMGRLLGGGSGT